MSETLVNTIDGDKLYAERAVKDASGNSISGTYATKSEIPVVDQAYDATSTNAQSGVAVAEALSNVPSPLSAGNGIDITSDVVSAKVDGSTISFNASGELQATVSGGVTDVTVDGTSVVNGQGVAEITMPTFTQVQSDWSQSDNTKVDYIKNKPSLATVATSGDYDDLTNKPSIPAAQVNSDWNASSGVAKILNKPNLATVATTGAYSDLTGTPTIPAAQVQSDWSQSDNTQVDYIKNKPTINNVPSVGSADDGKVLTASYSGGVGSYSWTTPGSGGGDIFPVEYGVTTYAQITDALTAGKVPVLKVVDSVINSSRIAVFSGVTSLNLYQFTSTYCTTTSSAEILGIGTYTVNSSDTWRLNYIGTSEIQADWNQTDNNFVDYIKNKPNLATVATSGDYDDLTNKPSIPAAQVNSDWNASSGVAEILNKPTLATVATSGSYNDLSDKPTIPVMELFEAVYGTTTYAAITSAIAATKIVYCKVSPSGASRMAFLAYIGSNNVEFQYYRSLSSRSATNQLDEVYVYTVTSSGWTTTTRKAGVLIAAGTGLTSSYSGGTLTLSLDIAVADQEAF